MTFELEKFLVFGFLFLECLRLMQLMRVTEVLHLIFDFSVVTLLQVHFIADFFVRYIIFLLNH